MPELVAGGPTIPVDLLNMLDSGKIVFFCGAGISAGPGSCLPRFSALVKHIYKRNRIVPDSVEREALDCEERDADRRRPALDKALGLLERDGRLGARALRRTVIERLSIAPSGELGVHQALIDLSRNERGVRLVTTNFDNRFVEAGLDKELVHAAPRLPVPKSHNWASLVHLHGRIEPNEDGSNLVLTAADFGRAYLTERWAARFVTELFREFTVVFVGYSVSDPVMGYMVDALAAERAKGASFAMAYAFGDEDGTDAGKSRARDAWRAKNVEPIIYDKRDHHRLLSDTLIEWARIRKDPFLARSRIAINEMAKMPIGPDDPVVERVVWALQGPVAAKALADEPPVIDQDEFVKFEKWLDLFTEKGLLSCVADGLQPGVSTQATSAVRLVDNGSWIEAPDNLDTTRIQLSRWLGLHLHVPQLVSWVLRQGGRLHPRLRQDVERNLAAKDSNIPARLRLLWSVLLDSEPMGFLEHLWTSDRYAEAASDSERRRIEEEIIEAIAPRLVVRPGPPSRLVFRQYIDNKTVAIQPIDACGNFKLVSGNDNIWLQVKEMLQGNDALAQYAETLTGHVEQALALGEGVDAIFQNSSWYRPSIAAHEQNQNYDGWTRLIDLARDSYTALAAQHRARAANLLLRWVESQKLLFRRLALFALTDNPKSDIQLARKVLLAGRKPGLWEPEMRCEVLRFFRSAGKRIPRSLRAEIVRAIHGGPRRNKGNA